MPSHALCLHFVTGWGCGVGDLREVGLADCSRSQPDRVFQGGGCGSGLSRSADCCTRKNLMQLAWGKEATTSTYESCQLPKTGENKKRRGWIPIPVGKHTLPPQLQPRQDSSQALGKVRVQEAQIEAEEYPGSRGLCPLFLLKLLCVL